MDTHIHNHARRPWRTILAYGSVDGHTDDRVGWMEWHELFQHRRTLQPIDKHVVSYKYHKRPQRPRKAHGGMDGDADDRVGGCWNYRSSILEYRGTLQPIDQHMDTHNHDRRPQRCGWSHGGVDGNRDDRVGWSE